jgi:DnaJ like chaperone protein
MSVWTRIADAVAALRRGEPLSAVFDRLRTPPERSVAFTIAVIALGAKMAKADGRVTRNEVSAFRRVFTLDAADEAGAARVFDLARQDVAGFESYARKIAAMFGPGDQVLIDLMDGLFYIAAADGTFHPGEEAFLREVATIFGLDARCFASLRARHLPPDEADPYAILGVTPDTPLEQIRAAWRQAVIDSHPDRLAARGVPEEALRLAQDRLVAVNRAWEEISRRVAA